MFDLMRLFNDRNMMPVENEVNHGLLKSDVRRFDDHYEVKVDVPGFSKADLHLNYADNQLTIAGQRSVINDHSDKDGNLLTSERSFGSVQRSYFLPYVDKEQIQAKLTDGVLIVELPKMAGQIGHDDEIEID